jgi:hypothetical protein
VLLSFTETDQNTKILVKSYLLILYNTCTIKWRETLGVSRKEDHKRNHYVNESAIQFVYYVLI